MNILCWYKPKTVDIYAQLIIDADVYFRKSEFFWAAVCVRFRSFDFHIELQLQSG